MSDEEQTFEDYIERLAESSDPAEMTVYEIYMSIQTSSHRNVFETGADYEVIDLLDGWLKIVRERMGL